MSLLGFRTEPVLAQLIFEYSFIFNLNFIIILEHTTKPYELLSLSHVVIYFSSPTHSTPLRSSHTTDENRIRDLYNVNYFNMPQLTDFFIY